jgi:ankyrin repeat protein
VKLEERDGQQFTMLSIASLQANLVAVDYLIKAGADVNAVGNLGRTPLDLAMTDGADPGGEVTKRQKEAGAKPGKPLE